MPERITKHGIQHVPRRRHARINPLLPITIVIISVGLSIGFLSVVSSLTQEFPQAATWLCPGSILLIIVGAGCIPFIQDRH
jgi:predicted benzoate:H+ symporter BenE